MNPSDCVKPSGRIGRLLVISFLSGIFLLPAALGAGVHQLWDEAQLFQVNTLDKVDHILQMINGKFSKDVMIETFPNIPEDFKQHYTDENREKFYENWAIVEARRLNVNGVFILITADPRHLHVAVGLDTRKAAFTLADRDELVALMTAAFHDKQYDAGIASAVQFVHDRMARNLSAPKNHPPAATAPTTKPAKDDGPGSF